MELNEEQIKVINLIKKNQNILLLGQAGTGKSRIITEIKKNIKDKNIYITSTTGISALNIGGMTLQSFLGIGIGDGTKEELYIKVYKNFRIRKILQAKNNLLIIDEVSMLSVDLFHKIDYIFKKIRNNDKAFGNIQMLLSGDFLQLEPINEEPIYNSELLQSFNIIHLIKNHRQSGDEIFQNILTNLRCNKLSDENIEILNKHIVKEVTNNDDIRLFTTNDSVNKYNEKHINSNVNTEYIYIAEFQGDDKYYINDFKKQFKTKNIEKLILKQDLKVMLTKNLDISIGLVNGSIGIITEFISRLPVVTFNNGIRMLIEKSTWQVIMNNKIVASAKQIPLIVAYASTIHKCQGLTLNSAIIDLKNSFAPHMIYVALSRVKNIEGLTLLNFNPKQIKINHKTIEFYEKLKI